MNAQVQTEKISLEYFKDHFQEVWSQCGRGRTYQVEGDFEVIELRKLGTPALKELVKPEWPPADLGWHSPCDI
tara:strand:+ start:183 stop:401 length:219 start_codon:yes stop_codon:yes gene_type:complete